MKESDTKTPQMQPPSGFTVFATWPGFSKNLEPLYQCQQASDTYLRLGLWVYSHHVNGFGIVHGGALSTFCDVLAGQNVVRAIEQHATLPNTVAPTISLDMQFINAAKQGDWIEGVIDSLHLKRKFAFVRGKVVSPLIDREKTNQDGVEVALQVQEKMRDKQIKTIAEFSCVFYMPEEGSFTLRQ